MQRLSDQESPWLLVEGWVAGSQAGDRSLKVRARNKIKRTDQRQGWQKEKGGAAWEVQVLDRIRNSRQALWPWNLRRSLATLAQLLKLREKLTPGCEAQLFGTRYWSNIGRPDSKSPPRHMQTCSDFSAKKLAGRQLTRTHATPPHQT